MLKKNVTNCLLILWIALLGADRIDLAGKNLFFNFTPFIFLSLLISPLLFYYYKNIEFRINLSEKKILIFFSALLLSIIPSVLLSNDFLLSLKRFILLNFEFFSIFIIVSYIFTLHEVKKILTVGAILGIIFHSSFSLYEELRWFAGSLNSTNAFIDLNIVPFAGYAPRLTGLSMDPNRACLIFISLLFLIFLYQKEGNLKFALSFILVTLIYLSLSKSGILILIISIFYYLVIKSNRNETKKIVMILFLPAIFSLAILIFVNEINFGGFISERISVVKGSSAAVHYSLGEIASKTIVKSTSNFFIGNGFQASQNLLEAYFPNNKYANFHTLYLSLIAESGIFSLILMLIFLAFPVIRKSSIRPLLAAVIVFNIFYQSILDPVFWFICVLGYILIPADGK
ncbi:hypothetical protein [Polynucleobacter sp. P1-05-14]|uniref:hypothetical protein n=1 Tax=Polynucleobacter sp. P1-05-14 TaxID=1819732 RepID=UPI001C0C296C|nr:hypothetical protein [Polynucleobacter sp. P1-05-14]MBU3547854.1 hypothetical protein [Polynucleobacter sp. P1-05-14]